jgi:hypothetical protein
MIFRLLPSGLLVFIALLQVFLVQKMNLSPWLGAGFAMFATTDRPVDRTMLALGQDPAGVWYQIKIPNRAISRQQVSQARSLPTSKRLTAFAADLEKLNYGFKPRRPILSSAELEKLKRENRLRVSDRNQLPLYVAAPTSESGSFRLKNVEVSVWRLKLNTKEKQLAWLLLGKSNNA